MSPEETFFEVGVSRHAPKVERSGELADVTKQEVDVAGSKHAIEAQASSFFKHLEEAPEGAIMAIQPSNVKRAEQTRDMLVEQLRRLGTGHDDITIVDLGADTKEAEKLVESIKEARNKKFIITGLRGTWLIGFKEDDKSIAAINKWKNTLRGDENLLGKVWAAHSGEIAPLITQLRQKGFDITVEDVNLEDFQSTPEDQVVRFITWLRAMKQIGESRFPGRTLMLEGISHNLRLDYTMIALLGEEISVSSIDRVLGGEFRKPLERSTVIFTNDGRVSIEYRGIHKEYLQEDLDIFLQSIKEQSVMRKQEWRNAQHV